MPARRDRIRLHEAAEKIANVDGASWIRNQIRGQIRAEFQRLSGVPGLVLNQVIPDTGADSTAVPWADCQSLQLNPAQRVPGLMSGVAGGSATTLDFVVWVPMDGNEYQCQLHADFVGMSVSWGEPF